LSSDSRFLIATRNRVFTIFPAIVDKAQKKTRFLMFGKKARSPMSPKNSQKPGPDIKSLSPHHNCHRNPVSFFFLKAPPETGFLLFFPAIVDKAQKKTRFLMFGEYARSHESPKNSQKPGFLSKSLSPHHNCHRNPVSLAGDKERSAMSPKNSQKPGFLSKSLSPHHSCHRNPVSFFFLKAPPETGFLLFFPAIVDKAQKKTRFLMFGEYARSH
jgi:prephenate dehydratase